MEDEEDNYFLARDVIESIDRARYEIVWCDAFDKALEFAKGEAGHCEINKEELYLKSESKFRLRLMMPHAQGSEINLQSNFERFDGYVLISRN